MTDTPATSELEPKFTRQATRLGIPPLGQYLSEAWRYKTFAVYWSKADIKARNFETFLGRVWHVLNPLLFGLIYFVFVGIVGGGGLGSTKQLAFIVGNLYVWGYFSGTISTGSGSIQGGAGGITAQSAIPRVILPFASTLTSTELFLRSLVAYIPLHIISNRGLHIEMLWMPYLLVVTGFFGFGLAMLFAVANVYVRDISRLLPHALRLWLYLSPAIWVYTTVLSDTTLDTLARVNPLYSGMAAWTIAFGGNLDANGPGIINLLVTFTLWALAIGIIGFLIFVSREDDFAIRN
jgi:teichoic acid transport system permease protein